MVLHLSFLMYFSNLATECNSAECLRVSGVCQLNCVMLPCLELLGDNPERLFLGKLRQGSIPCLSYVPLVA